MSKITQHPILEVPSNEKITFQYNGKTIEAERGYTIAAALHRAGYPVHSHSIRHRNRSLECGIGKCGACEMLVDGQVRRICITPVDGVREVTEIPENYIPPVRDIKNDGYFKVYHTTVVIIGAGPAGLAAREILNHHGISNIVVDANREIGGQFMMQTHQFFFFEQEKKYGGKRGFEIARMLAGDSQEGIILNSTVWDILEGKRVALKNIVTEEIFFIDCDYLVVAAGAVPFMPAFENDDLPGVYTAAVVQKMMNLEHTLLGKKVLTVGAGNIGYLVSYQLMQAGAKVKAIIEAQPREGGFPVQANRVRRLGIPILLSHTLVKALPNKDYTGITGAVVARCENFQPIPGTEMLIDDIDIINICTGLVPDDQLLIKGKEVFGTRCYGAGDAIRIGEGTSAVLRGKQVAYEILADLGERYSYDTYLQVSKEYIDSQQHPIRVLDKPFMPDAERMKKPFVIIDCLYGFACNPCVFACPHNAITKSSTSTVPHIDYQKCVGCMDCVYQCPGLAIFGYHVEKRWVFLPVEFHVQENIPVYLVDNHGNIITKGKIEKILRKPNKTHIVRATCDEHVELVDFLNIRGFIPVDEYPEPLQLKKLEYKVESPTYLCHCDDVTFDEILETIGDRKFISVDEIKHTTRLGMGACRGKRCIKRLKQAISRTGITVVGEPTPRAPLSNQIALAEMYSRKLPEKVIPFVQKSNVRKAKVSVCIAGGGIGGSALFRYFAEEGMNPLLVNHDRGASWRNIAGGRPVFSIPELSDIAMHNLEIFRQLQILKNIDFKPIRYVTFAHDEETYRNLEASIAWSDAYIVEPQDFQKEISPYFNGNLQKYIAALITRNCWQASPGKTIDLLRRIGLQHGGQIEEDCRVLDIQKEGTMWRVIAQDRDRQYLEIETELLVNALGANAEIFARKMGYETGLYPVRHQAFITRRLPPLGLNGDTLDMLIDRRHYKGFTAVYGQQLKETGQVIGCASPAVDPAETGKNIKLNTQDFLEVISEVFVDWIPQLSSAGFQAVWAGYYVEPRYIIDPERGLFIGLRGHGFMLSQYLAKLFVDKLMGRPIPDYFHLLSLDGPGLSEKAFK